MNDLFDIAPTRTEDPETSHKAAASVKNLTEARQTILDVLCNFGPQTDEQILKSLSKVGLKISASGARTRRDELCQMGLVRFSGSYGKTEAGRQCRIWEGKKASGLWVSTV